MKILLLGRSGQVGWELWRSLAPLGHLIALGRETDGGLHGDLNQFDKLAKAVRSVKPDIIVNAAGYTAVDKAEDEPELAHRINCEAPSVLAKEAKNIGSWLIHYSSDYVFDGNNNTSWKETDFANPVNTYGKTKLGGEKAIQDSGCLYIILRTSWIYAARRNNFLKTILMLSLKRENLKIVDDQFGAPTSAELIADVTAHLLSCLKMKKNLSGIYHLACKGNVSWYKYGDFIINRAREAGFPVKLKSELIMPVNSTEYKTKAKRPHNSCLDSTKLENKFHLTMPEWEMGVERCISELSDFHVP